MSPTFRFLLAATASASASPALSQEGSGEVAALEAKVAAQNKQIERLEEQLAEQAALLPQLVGMNEEASSKTKPAATHLTRVAVLSPPARENEAGFGIRGLDVSGDIRVREEYNFSDRDARDRARTVLRARLQASYAISGALTAGVRIVTGDPDDLNSADVTLGNFLDDLDVSLDPTWIRYTRGGLTGWVGKFPQFFARPDMVWDGDVSPQGIGAIYSTELGAGATLDARGLFFVTDEAPTARDSDMLGGQLVAVAPLGPSFALSLAGSYYHYRLGSVAGADPGDFRGNLIVGGRHVSAFRLIEGLATMRWNGASPRWPIALTADYVRNLGAAVLADTGFNIELAAGRAREPGDWRSAYNYSEVGVDALFAAFAHDNIAVATNYRLHGLGIGQLLTRNVGIDVNLYHYRPLSELYAGSNAPGDWLNRVRINLVAQF